MFLSISWRTREPASSRTFSLRNQFGEGKGWLAFDGERGGLAVRFEPRCSAYIEPNRHSALGWLTVVRDKLPELRGDEAMLRVSAVPRAWIDASANVDGLLSRLRLRARIQKRTLVFVEDGDDPGRLLEKAAAFLFTLDPFTRRIVSPVFFENARYGAIKTFGDAGEEILELLNVERGQQRLAELLGTVSKRNENSERENAIVSALTRLGTRNLVQFDCGIGRLLQELTRELGLESVVGVEASLSLVDRASKRLHGVADIRHGSVAEFDGSLSPDGTALVIEALPPPGDLRLRETERTLFRQGRFEWVLCVEGRRWSAAEMRSWAATAADHYGYRQRSWLIGGRETAVLFRRNGEAATSVTTSLPKEGREISTRLFSAVRIQPHQWASSLESFTRHTVDPRWLIYLPPGMASVQSDRADGYLEHPEDAFKYYRGEKIEKVVVELKHMGSRAVVVVCRDEKAASERFGIDAGGCIYTRNGRPFLADASETLGSIREGLSRASFWQKLQTNWACLDGELLPWTLKAERLLEETHGELLSCGETVGQEMLSALRRLAPREVPDVERQMIRPDFRSGSQQRKQISGEPA